jgi:hypothetical protein
VFDIHGNENIEFHIKDKNLLKDDTIGSCTLPIQNILASGFFSGWLKVHHLVKSKGDLLVEC